LGNGAFGEYQNGDTALMKYSRWMVVGLYCIAGGFGATAAVLAGIGIVVPSWIFVGGTTLPAVLATYMLARGEPKKP
jgi:hypothetical protein